MLRHVFKQLKLHCSPGDAHNYFSYPVIWQGWLLSRDLISIHHRSPCAWVTLKTLLSLTIQLKLKSIVLGFVCLFVYYSILFIFLSIYYYFFYFFFIFFFWGGGGVGAFMMIIVIFTIIFIIVVIIMFLLMLLCRCRCHCHPHCHQYYHIVISVFII